MVLIRRAGTSQPAGERAREPAERWARGHPHAAAAPPWSPPGGAGNCSVIDFRVRL